MQDLKTFYCLELSRKPTSLSTLAATTATTTTTAASVARPTAASVARPTTTTASVARPTAATTDVKLHASKLCEQSLFQFFEGKKGRIESIRFALRNFLNALNKHCVVEQKKHLSVYLIN